MQDMLKKIIQMDEQARKLSEQSKQHKIDSEQEIEALRRSIYEDYIARAKERIELNISVDKQLSDERLKQYANMTEQKKSDMQQLYREHKDEWVDSIVSNVLS